MRKYYSILFLLFFISCNKAYVPVNYSFNEMRLEDGAIADSVTVKKIQPYKDSLDAQMNEVVAFSAKTLVRAQPECDLGNLLVDMLLDKAQKVTGGKIDFAVMNYGGVRIPEMPAGNITRGRVFELMPFENRLVAVTIDGKTAEAMFNQMAKFGGWPVAGVTYVIKEGRAESILIKGAPLNLNNMYTFAVSDYIAGGGDKMDMLKGKPAQDLQITIRDVFMEAFREMNRQGKKADANIEGRVTVVK
jgi:2',3'-cyclic-nucleotide 2'-phosphodiesterase (5'-nucleotidase family)